MANKKTWEKPKEIIVDVGTCKFCTEMMTNQDSFVSFYGGEKSHYDCMKKDDQQRAEDKTFE